jgi:hypothetical protein
LLYRTDFPGPVFDVISNIKILTTAKKNKKPLAARSRKGEIGRKIIIKSNEMLYQKTQTLIVTITQQ